MPYVEDITEPLISTLTHTGGLPAHLLSGHAANLDFWVAEVKHAFTVIDGYGERFKRLKSAQGSDGFHPFHPEKQLKAGMRDDDLKELRRRLIDSVCLFVSRSYKEGFVNEEKVDAYAAWLGLASYELKGKKGP